MSAYSSLMALVVLAAALLNSLAIAQDPLPVSGVRTLPLQIPPEVFAQITEPAAEPTGLERVLLQALDYLKDIMKTGSADLDIPQLDPFTIVREDIDVETPQLTLKGNVSNLVLSGLSTYNVKGLAASLSPVAAILNFSVPVIGVKGLYDMQGKVAAPVMGDIPIYGKGNLTASVHGLDAGVTFELSLSDEGRINLQRLEAFFNIDDIKVHLDGLYGGQETSEFINNLLADALPKLFQVYRDQIMESLLTYAREALNIYLMDLHVDSPMEEETKSDDVSDEDDVDDDEEEDEPIATEAEDKQRSDDVIGDVTSEREWDLAGYGKLQLMGKTLFFPHGTLRRQNNHAETTT